MQHAPPQKGEAAADEQPAEVPPKGRGIPLSAKQKRELIFRLACGCSFRTAAEYAGCHASTVSRLMRQDEAFAMEVARFQRFLESEAIGKVRKGSHTQWRPAAFLLEFLDKRARRMESIFEGA